MTDDLTRIKKRHQDIPQEALPFDMPGSAQSGDEMKARTQKSIDWAACPHHVTDGSNRNGGLTGLVALDNKTLIFRDHTKKVGKVTIPCPGSGQIYERKGLGG